MMMMDDHTGHWASRRAMDCLACCCEAHGHTVMQMDKVHRDSTMHRWDEIQAPWVGHTMMTWEHDEIQWDVLHAHDSDVHVVSPTHTVTTKGSYKALVA